MLNIESYSTNKNDYFISLFSLNEEKFTVLVTISIDNVSIKAHISVVVTGFIPGYLK